MAPIGCACEGNILRATRATNLAERSLDKLLGVGHQRRGLANLGHGGGDQMRLDALDVHTVGLKLRTESSGPLLQECLAAGIGCQKRGGEETAERRHGKDETALSLLHARSDKLSDLQSSHAVNDDDIVHLLLGCLVERDRNVVAQTDIVDQDGDVKAVNKLGQLGVVGILVLREIHSQSLDRSLGSILGRYVGGEGVELGLGARDEDQVVALGREGESKLLANAIRSTSNEGPCATRTELGELAHFISLWYVYFGSEGHIQPCQEGQTGSTRP